MKLISINISKPKEIEINGVKELTGYFKQSINKPVFISDLGLEGDSVVDTVHHGGIDKACYLYSYKHYDYWKKNYHRADYDFGMFGENLTIDEFDESLICIGDVFQVGSAILQVSQPRQPCYKMGIRFGDQKIVSDFRKSPYPGFYVRVIQEGIVSLDNDLKLIKRYEEAQSVLEIYQLLYEKEPDQHKSAKALDDPYLSGSVKKYIMKNNG